MMRPCHPSALRWLWVMPRDRVFADDSVACGRSLGSALFLRAGTALMGFGGGLFAVGALTALMDALR
ncbi:hypothetical protein [Thiorhodovibrio winogradskyi]|uniref:hypothetical protein n=1 Tax=Thiorhodovibrio winogradskyi TaxID=77007 RepID=UPI002E28A03B|nr:hypothetical protein [Thiorhodovibrio winogradskyi]